MTETPDYTLEPVAEWTVKHDLEFKRSLVTGELADRVRERFGVVDATVPVYFLEHQEESGDCPTCYSIDNVLTVECGGHERSFYAGGLPLNKLLDWFNEPRRERQRAAELAVRTKAAHERDEVFTRGLVDAIVPAFEAVEAEGYRDDQEWHDKLMTKLGVKGYQT